MAFWSGYNLYLPACSYVFFLSNLFYVYTGVFFLCIYIVFINYLPLQNLVASKPFKKNIRFCVCCFFRYRVLSILCKTFMAMWLCQVAQWFLGRIPEQLMGWKRCVTPMTALIKRLFTIELLPLGLCEELHASDFAVLHNWITCHQYCDTRHETWI